MSFNAELHRERNQIIIAEERKHESTQNEGMNYTPTDSGASAVCEKGWHGK